MTIAQLPRVAAPLPEAAFELLERSRIGLLTAAVSEQTGERYVAAHLSALRAAAAVLATHGRPTTRSRPRSVWDVLPRVAPDLTEWAAFFASGAERRAALETGRIDAVPAREADDQVRAAETFLDLVECALGVTPHPALPGLRPAGP
jgi:hypothetical protein